MVANLTLGKDKYQDVYPQIEELLKKSEKIRSDMQELVEKDIEVFYALSIVFKMPRSTDDEKTTRSQKMQEALVEACEVPFKVGKLALQAAKLTQKAAEIGNESVIGDAGVATLLAHACARSAALMIKTNLIHIRDKDYGNRTWSQIQDIVQEVEIIEKVTLGIVDRKLGQS